MALMDAFRIVATVAVTGIALSACQTFGLGGSALVASTVTAELTPESSTAIAGDMVEQFAVHVGPAANAIRLRGDGSPFGVALEGALRSAGYAVVANSAANGIDAIEIAYVVDEFEGSVLVRLSTPTLDLTRLYRMDGAAVAPSGPLSVMQRGEAQTT